MTGGGEEPERWMGWERREREVGESEFENKSWGLDGVLFNDLSLSGLPG